MPRLFLFLALALALGASPFLPWAGNQWDPNGGDRSDAGSRWDPNG